MASSLALVVLAAGASERLGEPKALTRLGPGAPGTPLELLLAAGERLGSERALVVAGRDAGALSAALSGRPVDCVTNPGWRAGRTGSVQLAVRERPERDLCLAPVDVPLVPGAVFGALADEWARLGRPGLGWLAPCVRVSGERRFGHPVIVGRVLCQLLKTFPPDRPLRLLRASSTPLSFLEVASEAILDDLDSPADLERLRARWATTSEFSRLLRGFPGM